MFLLLAVVFGLAAATAVQHWLERQRPETVRTENNTRQIVLAKVNIPIGTALVENQIGLVRWPAAYLPDGVFFNTEHVMGRVLRRPVATGEPLLESLLLPEGSEAGLISLISEKKRAVSVKVDPVVGVAGFVKPGARVDVMVTVRRIDQKEPLPYSKVILQDVPVLAVDQKMEEVKDGKPELVSVVTLEVDPTQAERLIYAAHEGRLQLALRNPSDHEVVKTRSVGVVDLLGRRKAVRTNGKRSATVQVIKGSKISTKSF
jgi:pilus assembly protein CpaB